MDSAVIQKLIDSFGLSDNEKCIYDYLALNRASSAQEISKGLKLGRTIVYNSIEKLIEHKLVIQIIEKNGKIFEINTPESLFLLIEEKKEELASLEDQLPEIVESLSQIANTSIEESEIKYYSGQKGLEQVIWNSTKAKKFLRIYEIDDIDIAVGMDLGDKALIEYVKNKTFDKQLTNLKVMDNSTTIAEFIDNWWEARYIPPEEINIQFETVIYNNVVSMYQYQSKDIFCVEIYNEALAKTQKQIFDLVWSFAKPLRKLNSYGSAILDE